MRRLLGIPAMFAALLSGAPPVPAQSPGPQAKRLIQLSENSWAWFREFNGRQLIYFSFLEENSCVIAEVRYSLNSDRMDQVWPLPPCSAAPGTQGARAAHLTFPPGTVDYITIRLTFADGSKSLITRIGADNKPR